MKIRGLTRQISSGKECNSLKLIILIRWYLAMLMMLILLDQ